MLKHPPVSMMPEHSNVYLTATFGQFVVVHSSLALYANGLAIRSRYKLSWYDSLIVAAAAEADCSLIYTGDLQHGSRIEGLRIENPFRAKRSN